MTTPVDGSREEMFPQLPTARPRMVSTSLRPGTDDEGTVYGEDAEKRHIAIQTAGLRLRPDDVNDLKSPSRSREEAYRLEDDLAMLSAEREVSNAQEKRTSLSRTRSKFFKKSSNTDDSRDALEISSDSFRDKSAIYKPPDDPNTGIGKAFKKIHESFWPLRYFFYITPVVLVILIPLLLALFLFKQASVGGVSLLWFCIWLQIVWLSLWAGRIIAKCIPYPMGVFSSLFTNNSKKWRDLGKQLEVPATLFLWGLALEVSFLPTMVHHHLDGNDDVRDWEGVMNKVIVSIFVGFILNFVEKILVQLIAIRFHLRTYADRIDLNKFQIASLVKLYRFSKEKIGLPDREFEDRSGVQSGTRTPAQLVKEAQRNTMEAFKRIGDVTGKMAGDFTGRNVATSTHPHQVILALLASTEGSQALARRLYRTFCGDVEDSDTVHQDELRAAFDSDEEADAAFTMFDKDMNGDISMEELEAVCVEIGRERKSITASLKDLDSVVGKLDSVFLFIVVIITLLVFISLISTSAAGVLTSAGSSVLALSWLFSATAQEFLQSIIFVFVKHPFDVGDRVTVYGNTGSSLKGDDYFVKKISLLYTEFKKMEGHIVQAPNSYLNTLFILNQRRSSGLAEAVPITIKFGTTLEQIESLRQQLLDFVSAEKREYQSNIITELREVQEAHAIVLNIVFFYKSNWQNELLRLQRRNKFICALMVSLQECGIEGPRMRLPGFRESAPVYLQYAQPPNASTTSDSPNNGSSDPPFVEPAGSTYGSHRLPSVHSPLTRPRGESIAQMGRRVDFSLGIKDVASGDLTGDVYAERARPVIPVSVTSPVTSERSSQAGSRRGGSAEIGRSSSIARSPHGLQRVGTDTSIGRQSTIHKNRFFGRGPRSDETLDDMEAGMANIPEDGRLDPRTGMISPIAYRVSSDEPRPRS